MDISSSLSGLVALVVTLCSLGLVVAAFTAGGGD